jgi:adenosine deaminase
MPAALSLEFIEKLPKTDLHCHLDGSLRLDTILDLARRQGVTLPTTDRDGLFHLLYAGERTNSLDEYLAAFDITLSVLQTEEALERVSFELAEDAWRENVRYLEVRYSPLLHTRLGLRPAVVVEAVMRGLRAAKRQYGIRYGRDPVRDPVAAGRSVAAHRRAVRGVQEPRRGRLRPGRQRGQ